MLQSDWYISRGRRSRRRRRRRGEGGGGKEEGEEKCCDRYRWLTRMVNGSRVWLCQRGRLYVTCDSCSSGTLFLCRLLHRTGTALVLLGIHHCRNQHRRWRWIQLPTAAIDQFITATTSRSLSIDSQCSSWLSSWIGSMKMWLIGVKFDWI